VLGHVRYTTTGHQKINHNNHPWLTKLPDGTQCAVAHNGVIHNYMEVDKMYGLTKLRKGIETDSYTLVLLLHKFGITTDVFKDVIGSFVVTVLTNKGELYIYVHDNPVAIANTPDGIYYASTSEILSLALDIIGVDYFIEYETNGTEFGSELIKITAEGIVNVQAIETCEDYDYLFDYYGIYGQKYKKKKKKSKKDNTVETCGFNYYYELPSSFRQLDIPDWKLPEQ